MNSLAKEWAQRLALYAEAAQLRAEGDKLHEAGYAERDAGDKLEQQSDTLRKGHALISANGYANLAAANLMRAKAKMQRCEGHALKQQGDHTYGQSYLKRAEGDKIFSAAILARYGDVAIIWGGTEDEATCRLPNGELYTPQDIYQPQEETDDSDATTPHRFKAVPETGDCVKCGKPFRDPSGIHHGGNVLCPKCGAMGGDDWKQCNGACPMILSPHFNASERAKYARQPGDVHFTAHNTVEAPRESDRNHALDQD